MEVLYPRCCGLDVHKRRWWPAYISSSQALTPRRHLLAANALLAAGGPDLPARATLTWGSGHTAEQIGASQSGTGRSVLAAPGRDHGRGTLYVADPLIDARLLTAARLILMSSVDCPSLVC